MVDWFCNLYQYLIANCLTKIGPYSSGTFIDKRRRTRATPTKDFPVPGGPCKIQNVNKPVHESD